MKICAHVFRFCGICRCALYCVSCRRCLCCSVALPAPEPIKKGTK